MKKVIALLGSLLLSTAALADPPDHVDIPAWIDQGRCSGLIDVHRLSVDDLDFLPDGIRIKGYDKLVDYSRVQKSLDEYVWVFYAEAMDAEGKKWQSPIYCLFIPPSIG